MAPTTYDPNSEQEQPIPLPSAPLRRLSDNVTLQPPLTRRGIGPGLIVFLPSLHDDNDEGKEKSGKKGKESLDPEPQQKWAEEGFAVVARKGDDGWTVEETIEKGLSALKETEQVSAEVKDKFAVLIYDERVTEQVISSLPAYPLVVALVIHGPLNSTPTISSLLHLPSSNPNPNPTPFPQLKIHAYPSLLSPLSFLPGHSSYDHGSSTIAHTRSLSFLRDALDGPYFDLEAIWDEHTYYEFEVRSVAKTMSTMVQEPYVNHVPTMTGGIGRKKLTAFYRDHFIFSNPPDTKLTPVSRTIGPDRIVDEFIFSLTHTQTVDWLLPNVPPTGRKLSIPFVAVVNIRGDRLYHEHIWWDHASALKQAGLLPETVYINTSTTMNTAMSVRLPVVGQEGARMLVNEMDGESNVMMDPSWSGATTTQ